MNRSFLEVETIDQVNKYIDDLCSDPGFLCRNRDICGSQSTLFTGINNVNDICKDIERANECENDFQECVVLASNLFEGGQKYISTSFVNIIIPIPNALDEEANNKFIRLPALSSSKKPKSLEICSICSCMNRFATSPGAGEKSYTSPGQNECIYLDSFEYYYYPLYIENINQKLQGNAPVITLGKYKIINSNIIPIHSEEDLKPLNLYSILVSKGILSKTAIKFITTVLNPGNEAVSTELQLFLLNKKSV
jgi:hypothetical protein